MKRYKLLKDTPTLKAGTIFVEEGDNFNDYKELVQVVPYGCPNRPFFVVSEIDNFDDWFEEIHDDKRWRAEYGEKYWCTDGNGGIYSSTEDGHKADSYRFLTGNYFKTEEEAEVYKEYTIAHQVLLDDAEGGKFIPGKENWSSVYDDTDHLWRIQYYYLYHQGGICFRDKKSIEKSLETHKEQWEIVRKYEMGEKIND